MLQFILVGTDEGLYYLDITKARILNKLEGFDPIYQMHTIDNMDVVVMITGQDMYFSQSFLHCSTYNFNILFRGCHDLFEYIWQYCVEDNLFFYVKGFWTPFFLILCSV